MFVPFFNKQYIHVAVFSPLPTFPAPCLYFIFDPEIS